MVVNYTDLKQTRTNMLAEQTAYLINGEAVYIRSVIPGGYLVSNIYEVHGDYDEPPGETIEDRQYFAEKVFKEPPLQKQHDLVRTRQEQVSQLLERIEKMREEEQAARNRIAGLEDAFRRHSILQDAVDYLDGKITHVAYVPAYGLAWKVLTIQEYMAPPSPGYNHDDRYVRVLTLEPDRYSRSSAGSIQNPWSVRFVREYNADSSQVKMCRSEHEAIEFCTEKNMEMAADLHSRTPGADSDAVRWLMAHGKPVKKEWIKAIHSRMVGLAKEEIAKKKAQIDAEEARLNAQIEEALKISEYPHAE